MIYTEYQQVLLTQLQNNDKIIEEIKKEQEEIQGMFLQERKFKPGDLVQVDYKISNATFKVRGWIYILEESPVLSPEFTQERRFPRIKG